MTSQFISIPFPSYDEPTRSPPSVPKRNRGSCLPLTKHGLKGVYCHRPNLAKPWMAAIKVDGVMKYLGYFRTKEEAAQVYNENALRYLGPEAYLNPV